MMTPMGLDRCQQIVRAALQYEPYTSARTLPGQGEAIDHFQVVTSAAFCRSTDPTFLARHSFCLRGAN
jgi:hypothetical protein